MKPAAKAGRPSEASRLNRDDWLNAAFDAVVEGGFERVRVLALARHPAGQLALLAVIALFLFHGCHRLLHSLHDLGLRTGSPGRWVFYGFAALGSLATAVLLWSLRG